MLCRQKSFSFRVVCKRFIRVLRQTGEFLSLNRPLDSFPTEAAIMALRAFSSTLVDWGIIPLINGRRWCYRTVMDWGIDDDSEDEVQPKDARVRDDWFLSLKGAVPEAACSWLRLLHDTQSASLPYRITTKRLSIDYLPPGITRPLATIDLYILLVTLTALGVQWKDRGANGTFVGRNPQNHIEITRSNILSVGIVYSYERTSRDLLPVPLVNQHELREHSIPYICNRFELWGFTHGLSTWDGDEIHESLVDTFGDVELANYFKQHYKPGELNIGIGELVAGWCKEDSMPRYCDGDTDSRTGFSASLIGCSFGMPLLSALLCNKDSDLEKILVEHALDKEEVIQEFVDMIKGYYMTLELAEDGVFLKKLFGQLQWASYVPERSNILFYSPRRYRGPGPDHDDCLSCMEFLSWNTLFPIDRVRFNLKCLSEVIFH